MNLTTNQQPGRSLAEQVKAAREALGMTQQQFADAICAGRVSVINWESGRKIPTPLTLRSMYLALEDRGIKRDAIFDRGARSKTCG